MRLNLQSDYALRMLMQLSVAHGVLVTIADVADRYDISRNHLMKVANTLVQAGFIESVRGRNGGLRLGRPAEEIVLADVVRWTENDFAVVECMQANGGGCAITPACRLRKILYEASNAFLGVLGQYTLADLVTGNTELRTLLIGDAA